MERIEIKHINSDTPLSVIVAYLKQNINDKAARSEVQPFNQGFIAGKLEILDLLSSLSKGKDDGDI